MVYPPTPSTFGGLLSNAATCSDEANCGGAGGRPLVCTPGYFCKVAVGEQDVLLTLRGVDLAFAVGEASSLFKAKPRSIRCYVQVVLVPEGMDPDEGLHDPAAQVRVKELLLEPRVKIASGGGAKPAPAKKAEALQLLLKEMELEFVPKPPTKADK